MKIRFDLSIRCSDQDAVGRLRKVLLPDNKGLPKDQMFSMHPSGSSLQFQISSPRVMPALSTLEGILSDVGLFEELSQTAIGLTTKPLKRRLGDARRQASKR